MELEDETEMLVAEIAQFLGAEAAYIDAINHDAATIRLVEGTDNLEECSLAGTTRTDDTYHLALVNMQVDALKHLQGAEALGYTFYIYHFLTQNYFAGKIKQNIWKCLILRDKKKKRALFYVIRLFLIKTNLLFSELLLKPLQE